MYNLSCDNCITTHVHSHDTRGHDHALAAYHRLSQCQHSISYNGPVIWNDVPPNIKNSKNIVTFKKFYKAYLLEKYNEC